MRNNPERLAWTVLLTAFVLFCLLATGVPLLLRGYLLHARQPLYVQGSSQQGTVRVERVGGSRPDAVTLGDPPLELFKGDTIRTGTLAEGVLLVQRGDGESRETLASIVVYDNSDVVLSDAYSPRFDFSSDPHRVFIAVEEGRARIEVQPATDGRPVEFEVTTDHARIHLEQGSFALDVTNQQTRTTVRRGTSVVRTADQEVSLGAEQSAVASSPGHLEGPLSAERNLIVNGGFERGIDTVWVVFHNANDASARVTSSTDDEGTAVARFQHEQAQPSEIALIQTLNRNVKDLASLILHLKVRINYHSLSVCGSLGSECSVMVRVDYQDVAGNPRQWVHGFYAFEDPAVAVPYYCTTCPNPASGNHSRVPPATWFLYDSPNLMQIQPVDLRPAVIQSVRIYASGHSYDSMVTDVELLARE